MLEWDLYYPPLIQHRRHPGSDLMLAIQDSDKTREVDMGSVFALFSPISHDDPPFPLTIGSMSGGISV